MCVRACVRACVCAQKKLLRANCACVRACKSCVCVRACVHMRVKITVFLAHTQFLPPCIAVWVSTYGGKGGAHRGGFGVSFLSIIIVLAPV